MDRGDRAAGRDGRDEVPTPSWLLIVIVYARAIGTAYREVRPLVRDAGRLVVKLVPYATGLVALTRAGNLLP